METNSADRRMRTWVSDDGKHAAAGMSLAQWAPSQAAAARNSLTTGMDDISGAQTQGASRAVAKCAARFRRRKKPKYPPPPPAPRQPHLTYSQKSGELRDADGHLMDKGTPAMATIRDKPEFEDEKNRGPIPRGNYKVTEVIEDTSKDERRRRMGQHILRLEPADVETRQRLKEMNRDGFWIHNGESPKASQGCILTKETTRRRIPVGSILCVTL